jgi:hypothetical protein
VIRQFVENQQFTITGPLVLAQGGTAIIAQASVTRASGVF